MEPLLPLLLFNGAFGVAVVARLAWRCRLNVTIPMMLGWAIWCLWSGWFFGPHWHTLP